MWSAIRCAGTSGIVASSTAEVCSVVAVPIVSARQISSLPIASNVWASNAVDDGSISPSNGHENAIEIYPRTQKTLVPGAFENWCETFERLSDTAVDVLLAEGFAGRSEDRNAIDTGRDGAFEPFLVGRQRQIPHAIDSFDAFHDLDGIGHQRHRLSD